jgi:glutamate/tyrosine decarboxylase-like PLP-dependent enzyme
MTEKLPSFQGPLSAALHHAIDHLTPASASSVAATADLATLRTKLSFPLDDSGRDATEIIEDLIKAVEGGIIDSAGPRFFGWVIGGSLSAALAADWLTSAWDQNAGLYATSPAAAVVEEIVGGWLKDLLHLPATASFALVTGCQMAHVTCLLAARHALLARRQWDVEKEGLAGSPPIRILTSTEIHGSTVRAVRMLGLGEKHIVGLPIDSNGRLREDALVDALKSSPSQPTILVLQAGDLNIGAFDDFAKLIPLAKKHGAWVHVDGAFGLWCAASPRLRHLLNGADAADSWTTDGHKWLNVPYDAGYAFCAHPAAHVAATSYSAAYLTGQGSDALRGPGDYVLESSRRARGFTTWAALRQLGRSGVAELVDRCCALARRFAHQLATVDGVAVVNDVVLNQVLVRFGDDEQTNRVIDAVQRSGECWMGGTTWHGMRLMRISVSSWRTTEADVDRSVAAIVAALQQRP